MKKLLVISILLSSFVFAGKKEKLYKITQQRIKLDLKNWILCRGPKSIYGPHTVPEVDIFMNDTALKYRRSKPEDFDYPVGSIFIKRKYSHENATSPDIATRMEKTSRNGTIQDWNFTIVSLPNNKPLQTEADCVGCHKRFSSRGFISRVSEQAIQVILNPLKAEPNIAEQPATRLQSKPK